MKLKLDENLSKAAGEIFRQAGHNTESVISQGMAGSPDQKVISVDRTLLKSVNEWNGRRSRYGFSLTRRGVSS